jgi:hypothetical protein
MNKKELNDVLKNNSIDAFVNNINQRTNRFTLAFAEQELEQAFQHQSFQVETIWENGERKEIVVFANRKDVSLKTAIDYLNDYNYVIKYQDDFNDLISDSHVLALEKPIEQSGVRALIKYNPQFVIGGGVACFTFVMLKSIPRMLEMPLDISTLMSFFLIGIIFTIAVSTMGYIISELYKGIRND